jgi:hypothetical protein
MRPELRGPIIPGSGIPVIPPGNFQGDSTYNAHYLNNIGAAKASPYRPKETPLAQGAFNGATTYNDHYINSGLPHPVLNLIYRIGCLPSSRTKRANIPSPRSGAFEI